MAGIKDAIIEALNENPTVRTWATGGIWARRAPQQAQGAGTRDRFLVVRVTDCDPNESHVQGIANSETNGPATITTDRIEVTIWAKSSKQADIGSTLVRIALDNMGGLSDGIYIDRIFWRGTVDREVEDASGAEQLLDGCVAEFDVAYRLPTGTT